jgi:hypothetical protein
VPGTVPLLLFPCLLFPCGTLPLVLFPLVLFLNGTLPPWYSSPLNTLANKVHQLKDSISTEEATKNAFVMPFLSQILGYDVFNPSEVVPEYTADIGTKKGEKVDYAIINDNEIQILVECKKCSEQLNELHQSQLSRYFNVTKARISLLTND